MIYQLAWLLAGNLEVATPALVALLVGFIIGAAYLFFDQYQGYH